MAEQTKHPIHIRPFRADDVDFVIDRQLALYKEEYGFDSDVWRAYLKGGVHDLVAKFDQQKDCLYILEYNGERAGSMAVTHEDDETAKLRFFFVASNMRGLGAGRALFGKAVAFCREKGYKRAFLWTFSTLYAARHIYASFGFQITETNENNDWGEPITEERWDREF